MATAVTQSLPRDQHYSPERRDQHQSHTNLTHRNVGETERLLSLAGGGLLLCTGLTQRSVGGLVLAGLGAGLVYRGLTGHCPAYQQMGLNTSGHSPQASIPAGEGAKVEESVTVRKSPEELYRYWRQLENLPNFMSHVKSVKQTGGNRSHWEVEGPVGNVSWDAEIITEKANELLGWKSLEGSLVDTAGSVHFLKAPGDQGTDVIVSLKYNPPGGQVGAAVAWLVGLDPQKLVREDLQRFKELMESGSAAKGKGSRSRS
jgi:uncharacterized membrane protein